MTSRHVRAGSDKAKPATKLYLTAWVQFAADLMHHGKEAVRSVQSVMQPARRRSDPKLMLHEDDADEDVEDIDVEDEVDADADVDDDDEPIAELADELDIDAIAAASKMGEKQRKSSPGAAILSSQI
jgi:hypothetical protein